MHRSSVRRRTRPSSARRWSGSAWHDRVEFRGHRDDVAAELAELDVVVHCLDRARAVRPGGGRGDGRGPTDHRGGRRRAARDRAPTAWTGSSPRRATPDALAAALTRLAEDPELGRRGSSRRRGRRRRGSRRRTRPRRRRPSTTGSLAAGGRGERARALGDRHPLGEVLGLDRAAPGSRALRARSARPRGPQHEELETLYWTKAASVLGRPQDQMVESTVPVPGRRRPPLARRVPRQERRDRARPRSRRDRAHRPLDRAAAPARAVLPREVTAPPAPGQPRSSCSPRRCGATRAAATS